MIGARGLNQAPCLGGHATTIQFFVLGMPQREQHNIQSFARWQGVSAHVGKRMLLAALDQLVAHFYPHRPELDTDDPFAPVLN
jgi:hypothetical protein